jgi:hypothetical protein
MIKGAQPIAFPQRLQLLDNQWPGGQAVCLDVHQKGNSLLWIGVKDSSSCLVVVLCRWVLPLENLDQRIDVERPKSSVWLQSGNIVPDEQILSMQPDIRFDADAPDMQCREQRNFPPVVIVGMARDGQDVPEEIRGIPSQALCARARASPVAKDGIGAIIVISVYLLRDKIEKI